VGLTQKSQITKFFVVDIFAMKKRTVNTSILDVVTTAVLKRGTVQPHMVTQALLSVITSVIRDSVRTRVIVVVTGTELNVLGAGEHHIFLQLLYVTDLSPVITEQMNRTVLLLTVLLTRVLIIGLTNQYLSLTSPGVL
jgi:hypothetical protein